MFVGNVKVENLQICIYDSYTQANMKVLFLKAFFITTIWVT